MDAGFEWRDPGCSMCLNESDKVQMASIVPLPAIEIWRPKGLGLKTHLCSQL